MRSQRYAGLGTGVFQQPGPKAVLEEAVGGALVDEEFREAASIRDYRGGAVEPPRWLVLSEILSKTGLDQPAVLGWMIGANAEQLLKRLGFFKAIVRAPWQPIE